MAKAERSSLTEENPENLLGVWAIKALETGETIRIVPFVIGPMFVAKVMLSKYADGDDSRLTWGNIAEFYINNHPAEGFGGMLCDHLEVVKVSNPQMGELDSDPDFCFRRKSGRN